VLDCMRGNATQLTHMGARSRFAGERSGHAKFDMTLRYTYDMSTDSRLWRMSLAGCWPRLRNLLKSLRKVFALVCPSYFPPRSATNAANGRSRSS